jgi:hypothetical protein
MSLLAVQLDKSGDISKPLVVVAGFIASDRQWDMIGRAWKKATKGIGDFHMAAFMASEKEFNANDWPQPRKDRLIKTLTGIIAEHTRARIAVGVCCQAFREADLSQAKEYARDEYRLCCSIAIVATAEWGRNSSKRERVDFVFDHGDGKFYDETTKAYGLASTDPDIAREWKLGSISFSNRHDAVGLQAADLIAHLLYKHEVSVLRGEDSPIHPYLLDLLKIHRGGKRAADTLLKTPQQIQYFANLFSGFRELPTWAFKGFNPRRELSVLGRKQEQRNKFQLALARVKESGHSMFWEGPNHDEGTLYLVDSATYRALEQLPSHLRSLDTLKKRGFAVVATAVE